MRENRSTTHLGYDIGRQLSAVAMLIGAILLIDHLAGQIRHGAAPANYLLFGAISFGAGFLFFVLFGIGIRLARLEQLLLNQKPAPPTADNP